MHSKRPLRVRWRRCLWAAAIPVATILSGGVDRAAAQCTGTLVEFDLQGIIETYEVPSGVDAITITARGGEGGASGQKGGGFGASIQGTFEVSAGSTLQTLVGGKGEDLLSGNGGGGGGGGSFVAVGSTPGTSTPLLIAGGGGGAGRGDDAFGGHGGDGGAAVPPVGAAGGQGGGDGGDGGFGITGGSPPEEGGMGGAEGNGGAGSSCSAGGGGGFFTGGGGDGRAGAAFVDGGLGGVAVFESVSLSGGFGGGGAPDNCGGGGGGFNGGGAGGDGNFGNATQGGGGGGGSLNLGSDPQNQALANTGDGSVEFCVTFVPEPTRASLALTALLGVATVAWRATAVRSRCARRRRAR